MAEKTATTLICDVCGTTRGVMRCRGFLGPAEEVPDVTPVDYPKLDLCIKCFDRACSFIVRGTTPPTPKKLAAVAEGATP